MDKVPTAEEVRNKYMPNGAHNLRHINGGDGKPQYKYEKKIMTEMLIEFAKLHIKAYKEEIKKKIGNNVEMPISGGSILSCYLEENIK